MASFSQFIPLLSCNEAVFDLQQDESTPCISSSSIYYKPFDLAALYTGNCILKVILEQLLFWRVYQ